MLSKGMLFLLAVAAADAFCGTYVGPVGSSFENTASQVILAHGDGEVVLTLAADVRGTAANFAMVVPVPEVLDEGDVTLADPTLFDALGAWSAPRVVSYTCSDFYWDGDQNDADSGSAGGGGSADGVTVEHEFTVGSYEIVVLSATGGTGLYDWLSANGYDLPASSVAILDEYVDAGQHFVAAKVNLSADPAAAAYLQPLQLRYASPGESFVLPIRIGTTVSPGEQEVIAYVVTPGPEGRVAVSNYPEATVEESCMPPEGTTDYGSFYDAQLLDAFDEGVWLTEYAWSATGCDPCSSDPPSPEQLAATGVRDDYPFVTRLRLRYTAAEATQDVVLYPTNDTNGEQVRYIEYLEELESTFPVCGVGMVPDGGECPDQGHDADTGPIWGDPPSPADNDADDASTGLCATVPAGSFAALGAALLTVAARRRR